MKLFIFILIVTMAISCQNTSQSDKQSTNVSKTENVISENKIIEAVKNHQISDSFTAGQIIDSLSRGNSITTWQVATFKEYQSNNDIIGVIGETTYQSFGGGIKFKIAYIYQISTAKINFYAGFRNGKTMSELDFIVSYHEIKALDEAF